MSAARRLPSALVIIGLIVSCTLAVARDEPAPSEDEPAPAPEPLELRVNRAVDRGCAHLLSKQEEAGGFGTWDKVHPLGRTSLCLLALLHGGVAPTEERVARGIEYLLRELQKLRETRESPSSARTLSTYETGITLMLLYDLGPNPRFAGAMEPLARYLIAKLDRSTRLWGYPEGTPDLSNAQYAILGLRAAARRGIRPPGFRETLLLALQGVLTCQKKNGGFAYQPHLFARASLTVAALAMIRFLDAELEGWGAATKDLIRAKKAIAPAEEWLARNWSVEEHREGLSRSMSYYYYYMYGLERYAAFYEKKEIAGHRWYQEGAEALLAKQNDDGGFGASIEDTAFAILFLKKASLTTPSRREGAGDEARQDAAPRKPEERAADGVPHLREWLVLGPFPQTDDDDALVVDHIGEKRVKPAHGKATKGGTWQRHVAEKEDVDLIAALAPNGGVAFDRVAAYAACYLTAEEATTVRLWMSSDDGIRVFVNGELAFEDHHHDGKDGMKADVALKKGGNLVLVKVENVGYGCRFRMQLTTLENTARADVTASTRP
jgi:hypothetical protein